MATNNQINVNSSDYLGGIKRTVYTSGTATFTPDARMVGYFVEVWGGGGGSGGCKNSGIGGSVGVVAGGGSGGYVCAYLTSTNTSSVSIGAGGSAGTGSTPTNGGTGGTTTFTSDNADFTTLSATGGSGCPGTTSTAVPVLVAGAGPGTGSGPSSAAISLAGSAGINTGCGTYGNGASPGACQYGLGSQSSNASGAVMAAQAGIDGTGGGSRGAVQLDTSLPINGAVGGTGGVIVTEYLKGA